MAAYVVGNIAIDETIAVDELPVPGASILGRQQSRDLGGKGANQAVVMARAGLPTTLVAPIGDDFRADSIRRRLVGEPVEKRLVTLAGRPSDLSMILSTPDGENSIVTTTDCAQNLMVDDALKALEDARPGDTLVLQGNLTDETTRALLASARHRGMKTAFNPSPVRPFFARFWDMIDMAFLNEGEAELLSGRKGAQAVRHLREAGVGTVVLTRGARGALVGTADGLVEITAHSATTVDTTGAGDTFMGTALASAALRGADLDALAIGHAAQAAAITVGRHGTLSAFPTVDEFRSILARR